MEGNDASYIVTLDAEPVNYVALHMNADFGDPAIRLLDDGGQEVTALILLIDEFNYASGVTVTVRALQNGFSGENPPEMISHIARSDGLNAKRGPSLLVTVTDDEEPAVRVSMSLTVSEGTEGDDSLIFNAHVELLDSNGKRVQRRGETTDITFEFSPAEVAGDYTLNVETPVTYMVRPAGEDYFVFTLNLMRDSICEGDETFIVTGNAEGLESGTATFTIMDHPDDVEECGLEIGEIADVTEGGATIYTLALRSEPAETVTVAISSASDEVRLSPSPLVFTEMNWHIPQDIGVHTTDNEFGEGPRDVAITHVVTGGKYDAFPFASTVTILDDEVASTRVGLFLK